MNILSLSYGKDSIACLEACKQLGWKIDKAIHAEVWATDDIPADLPPMVEFKQKADRIIKERYGIEVEHRCAMRKVGGGTDLVRRNSLITMCSTEQSKTAKEKKGSTEETVNAPILSDSLIKREHGVTAGSKSICSNRKTYESVFYRMNQNKGQITGFPMIWGNWCTSELKKAPLNFLNMTERKWCSI